METYLNREYKLSMSDDIYKFVTDIMEQSELIGARMTFLGIYHNIPEEVQSKIHVTRYDDVSKRRLHWHVDIRNWVDRRIEE